jgi:hypothetical protein
MRNGSAARRRACDARASASGSRANRGLLLSRGSARPESPWIPPSSRCAPAGWTASNGPPVTSVPHGRASYRGRCPPLGTSPSTLRSQACARVALKRGRCSSLDAPTPPHCSMPAAGRHGGCSVNVIFPSIPSPSQLPYTSLRPRGSLPCRALPEFAPASPEFPTTAASAGHRRRAASPAFPPPKSRRPSAPR